MFEGVRYMLLAERLRSEDEKAAMKTVLEEQVCCMTISQSIPPRASLNVNWMEPYAYIAKLSTCHKVAQYWRSYSLITDRCNAGAFEPIWCRCRCRCGRYVGARGRRRKSRGGCTAVRGGSNAPKGWRAGCWAERGGHDKVRKL